MTLFVTQQTEIVKVTSVVKACADANDDRILAAALDAGCSLLVTGDADYRRCEKTRHQPPHTSPKDQRNESGQEANQRWRTINAKEHEWRTKICANSCFLGGGGK